MGSAFHLPKDIIGCKEVLSTFATRAQAMEEEIRLHALYNVKDNPDFYNQCNATSTAFQVSEEAHKRSAETRRGRTKETHEYIARQVDKRAKYKGDGLTLAQKKQWDESRKTERLAKYKKTLEKTMSDPEKAKTIHDARVRGGKSCKGIPNPAKGHTGLAHPRAKAWWYKHPDGNVTLVNSSIRDYVAKHASVFPVSSATIMRYLRENKVPPKILEQGWDFGLQTGKE